MASWWWSASFLFLNSSRLLSACFSICLFFCCEGGSKVAEDNAAAAAADDDDDDDDGDDACGGGGGDDDDDDDDDGEDSGSCSYQYQRETCSFRLLSSGLGLGLLVLLIPLFRLLPQVACRMSTVSSALIARRLSLPGVLSGSYFHSECL